MNSHLKSVDGVKGLILLSNSTGWELRNPVSQVKRDFIQREYEMVLRNFSNEMQFRVKLVSWEEPLEKEVERDGGGRIWSAEGNFSGLDVDE